MTFESMTFEIFNIRIPCHNVKYLIVGKGEPGSFLASPIDAVGVSSETEDSSQQL